MTDVYGTLAWWAHDADELICLECFPRVKDDYEESLMKIFMPRMVVLRF